MGTMKKTKTKNKMTLADYMALPYTFEITKSGESFFGRVKELPGCMTEADSRAEAVEMLQEAFGLWLETALDLGKEIPLPQSESEYSGKVLIRMPPSLHKRLSIVAAESSMSLNTLLISLLDKNSDLISDLREQNDRYYDLLFQTTSRRDIPLVITHVGPSSTVSPSKQSWIQLTHNREPQHAN